MYVLVKIEIYLYQRDMEKLLLQHILEVNNIMKNVHAYCHDVEKWSSDVTMVLNDMKQVYEKEKENEQDTNI